MKVKNISYPYPVLGNEDDIKGEFVPKFNHILGNKIELKVKFELKNPTIEKLIEEGKAIFSVEVECNSTFFRTSFLSNNYEDSFEIDSPRCRDRVVVKFYVRANQSLVDYSNADSNKDYEGITFDLSKGDVLACGGQSSFIAEKGFDPLRPVVSSFIAVQEGDDKEGPIKVDFWDSNRIFIKLNKQDWNKYQALKGRQWIAPIIHSAIVFPVLAEAIRLMEFEQDVQGTRWCARLKTIMEQKGLAEDDPFSSAQGILQYPLSRSLINIESQELSGEEEF